VSNQFYFTLPTTNKTINLPIEIKWDFLNRTDSIEIYEDFILGEVIGLPKDFEVTRFSHAEYSPNEQTKIRYEFYFWNQNSLQPISTTTNVNDWQSSYLTEGFTSAEVYYFTNSFTNSFFKLDFYDTNDVKTQKNYFTVIIPVQQGETMSASTSNQTPNVQIKKPIFNLDFIGDKEGFFFYWLLDREYLNLDTFYMSAKFFDAKLGVFVKMMTTPQASLPSNRFTFDGSRYFFYQVKLDYDNKTYKVFEFPYDNIDRVGITNKPIKWYEYVNP
jgi:hypothetical protein